MTRSVSTFSLPTWSVSITESIIQYLSGYIKTPGELQQSASPFYKVWSSISQIYKSLSNERKHRWNILNDCDTNIKYVFFTRPCSDTLLIIQVEFNDEDNMRTFLWSPHQGQERESRRRRVKRVHFAHQDQTLGPSFLHAESQSEDFKVCPPSWTLDCAVTPAMSLL